MTHRNLSEVKRTRSTLVYTFALVGLGLLLLCAVILFLLLAVRAYDAQHQADEIRSEFRQQWALWQAQGIDDYRIGYDNCSPLGICCQNVTLRVMNGALVDPLPNCAANQPYASYYGYDRATAMDETYGWLNDWLDYNRSRHIELEYHPDLHYITYIRFTPFDGGREVVIEYADLRPQ